MFRLSATWLDSTPATARCGRLNQHTAIRYIGSDTNGGIPVRNNPSLRSRLFTRVALLLATTLALSAVAVPAVAAPQGCEAEQPVITGPMSLYLVAGHPVVDHSFSTGCDEATSWEATGDLPPGVAFDATTARFTGTPTTDSGGSFEITATDSRGAGLFEGSFEVINPELTLSGPDGSVIDLTGLERGSVFEVGGFAPDGSTVDVLWNGASLGETPGAGSFARELTVPADTAPGTHVIGVTIEFYNGQSYSFGFEVEVAVLELTGPSSIFPVIGSEFVYSYAAVGAGPDATYTLLGELPAGMVFSPVAGTISGTPETVERYVIVVRVDDGDRSAAMEVVIDVVADAAVRSPIHLDPPGNFLTPGMLNKLLGLDPDDAGSVGELDELIERYNDAARNSSGTPNLLTGVDPVTGESRFFFGSQAESAREQNQRLADNAQREIEKAKQERIKALELERQKRLEAQKAAEELLKLQNEELKKKLQEQLERQKRAKEEAAEAAKKRAEEQFLKQLQNEAAKRMLEQRQAALAARPEPSPLPAGTKVQLELHSTPVLLGQATVGASGGFLIRASVPLGTPPGLHHLVVTYTLPDGTVQTQAMAVNVIDSSLLPPTGADVAPVGYAASALMLLGLAAILLRRRLTN